MQYSVQIVFHGIYCAQIFYTMGTIFPTSFTVCCNGIYIFLYCKVVFENFFESYYCNNIIGTFTFINFMFWDKYYMI